MFLLVYIDKTLARGRPFRKNKDAITESIRILIPSLPDSGDFNYWFGYAQDEGVWEKMIKNLFKTTYHRYNCNNYPNTRSRARYQEQNHNQSSNPNASLPKTPSPP